MRHLDWPIDACGYGIESIAIRREARSCPRLAGQTPVCDEDFVPEVRCAAAPLVAVWLAQTADSAERLETGDADSTVIRIRHKESLDQILW